MSFANTRLSLLVYVILSEIQLFCHASCLAVLQYNTPSNTFAFLNNFLLHFLWCNRFSLDFLAVVIFFNVLFFSCHLTYFTSMLYFCYQFHCIVLIIFIIMNSMTISFTDSNRSDYTDWNLFEIEWKQCYLFFFLWTIVLIYV